MNFSIVIPLYNKAPYVKETLESVFHQTKLPYELIIVDDKSTDGSLEQVKIFLKETATKFKEVRVEIIELEKNRGVGHARNRGFAKTTGDVVSFLDADDLYVPQLIQKANQMVSQQYIDFLVIGIQVFPSNIERPDVDKLNGLLTPIISDGYLLEQPLKTITSHDFVMGTGSNVFVKRKWMQSTSYVEDAAFNEANDFWYRVLKVVLRNNNTQVGLLMGNYIKVREVQGSLSRLKYANWRQIEVPPIYIRYLKSKNRYDRLLMGVICNRWIKHAMRNLTSKRQKLIFIFKQRVIILNQLRYFFLRVASK
jgi:glycosyltransferase involved in cell wall biosynthesis